MNSFKNIFYKKLYTYHDYKEAEKALNEKMKINEPFKGLFTQGMVCHETYKNEKNNWVSPEEVRTNDGKKYFLK